MKKRKVIASIVAVCFSLALLSTWVMIFGCMKRGEQELHANTSMEIPDMSSIPGCVQNGDQLMYRGNIYKYDPANINILFMGIDARGEDESIGQADMLALVVINTEKDTVKCICINRDSIGPVAIYDISGKAATTKNVQIALAYSYGKSQSEGRGLEVDTVSKLLHGIPIHGSVSVDIDGIGGINELVGGITLTALEDVPKVGIVKGEEVTLNDEQAMYYVTERDSASTDIGTNENRMSRQKQYISAWCDAVQQQIKKNPFKIFKMYDSVQGYVDTDISRNSMLYLAKVLKRVQFGEGDIYMVSGDYERENYYDKYLIDEDKLTEMMIETFYRKTE